MDIHSTVRELPDAPEWGTRQVAAYLGVPEARLHMWNHRGRINVAGDPPPRSYKVGGRRKYRPADVEKWLEGRASRSAA